MRDAGADGTAIAVHGPGTKPGVRIAPAGLAVWRLAPVLDTSRHQSEPPGLVAGTIPFSRNPGGPSR